MTSFRSFLTLKTAGVAVLASALFIAGCSETTDPEPTTAPIFTTQPQNDTVAIGGTATFTVFATGSPTYQWVRNGNDTLTTTSATLTIANVTLADSGDSFRCVARNAAGQATSITVMLITTAAPTVPDLNRQALIDTGIVLAENCFGCHGPLGNGQGHGGPVLANSDYVMGSKTRLIATVLKGVSDSIRVNGIYFGGGGMPSWAETYSDVEVAGILTYIRSVLNDTLYTNCVNKPVGETEVSCTKVPRDSTVRIADTVSVAQVKSVRDSLFP